MVSLPGPGNIVIGALVCMLGWTIFAYFANVGCDPLKEEVVDNSNQVKNIIHHVQNLERSIYYLTLDYLTISVFVH